MKALLRPLVRPIRRHIINWQAKKNMLRELTSYPGVDLETECIGNDAIADAVRNCRPSSIVKIGGVELNTVLAYLQNISTESDQWKHRIHMLHVCAGIFPEETDLMEEYCRAFLDALEIIDILAIYFNIGEAKLVHKYCKNTLFVNPLGFEPYYFDNPWSKHLEGKNVLVIHPFKDSIKAQYDRHNLVWGDNEILPDFNLLQIKMPLSDALVASKFSNWREQLNDIKNKMDTIDYDVALVGAGAFSLLITEHAKLSGKIGIHLGGATQILFGIKGSRWDNHPIISGFFNEYWVRPLQEETPQTNKLVEEGCYW